MSSRSRSSSSDAEARRLANNRAGDERAVNYSDVRNDMTNIFDVLQDNDEAFVFT